MTEPVIQLRDVAFSYGGEPVLENVSFSVDPFEAVCVVGPNGGGKTTLVRLILGLLSPSRGEIRVFGQSPRRARLRVGYMPQHVQHDAQFPVTAMDLVLMGRLGCRSAALPDERRLCHILRRATGWPAPSDRRVALDALDRVDMADCAARTFASLSGGQRQRVLIARALAGRPDLLLLDEPTSNVDSLAESRLLDLLRELNNQMTIVMVSHDLGFVSEFVDRVICVNRSVAVHPTSQMTGQAIRDIYGGDVRRVRHDEFSHGES